jgi:Fungal hydrophobin
MAEVSSAVSNALSHSSQRRVSNAMSAGNSVLSSREATQVYGILLGLLGITIPANTIVGVHCSSLNIIGGGGNTCTQQTVCCNGNTYNGLITLGCSPSKICHSFDTAYHTDAFLQSPWASKLNITSRLFPLPALLVDSSLLPLRADIDRHTHVLSSFFS